MTVPCEKEEFLGEVKEFINNSKGLKATIFTIAFAILIQVCTFLFLWGGLVTTVKYHDKNIDKILAKLETVKVIGYAVAGEKGIQGIQGLKGDKGDKGEPY